jgi:hypothetical protein
MSKQGANIFGILSGKALISFNIDETQKILSGNTPLQNNTWYHLAASFDGSNIRLYVNGQQDANPLPVSGNLSFTYGLLYFGLYIPTYRIPFMGYMDEVKIYSYALNDTEILNHYKAMREQMGLLGL